MSRGSTASHDPDCNNRNNVSNGFSWGTSNVINTSNTNNSPAWSWGSNNNNNNNNNSWSSSSSSKWNNNNNNNNNNNISSLLSSTANKVQKTNYLELDEYMIAFDDKSLNKLTTAQLMQRLRAHNLEWKGLKHELVERWKDYKLKEQAKYK